AREQGLPGNEVTGRILARVRLEVWCNMEKSSRSGRSILLLFIVVLLAGAGVAAYFFWWKKPKELPGPGSPVYQEYVEAFQVGVAALDAGANDTAQKRLTEAIEKIPEEPAAWANRGLLHLRKSELKEAIADLNRAHELAPDSPEIENLLGWLAANQGKFRDAAEHFRKALEHTPQDLLTRYALAQILEKQGGTAGDAGYQEQLEEILRIQPNNLHVLQKLVGIAARRGDREALTKALKRLRKLSPAWSERTRNRLAELEKDAEGPLPGKVGSSLLGFLISLRSEPGYARGYAAVEGRQDPDKKSVLIGTSVQHFLR